MSAPGPLPEPEILVRKVKVSGHGGHHGGAWKVAYADFVTAMMAFFLLMWLLGATDEDQRRGIADYFAPSLVKSDRSGGSNGVLAGRSLHEPDGIAPHPQGAGIVAVDPRSTAPAHRDRPDTETMEKVKAALLQRLARDPSIADLASQIRLTHTPEGLRIELIDRADYSMFSSGTALLDPRAARLLRAVAEAIAPLPQKLAIRGHTDAMPFGQQSGGNNWQLSAQRAEATRFALAQSGISTARFSRLEGVADTEPMVAEDPFDPRNRRLSITLLRS
jgi:chemotaxis protein MotB